MRLIPDRKTPAALFVLLIGIVVIVFAAHRLVLQQAAKLWIVSDPLDKPADAIVVLGGGLESRSYAAADLYRRGLGREVWITHGKSENGAPELKGADPTRAMLVKFGVPEAAIVDVPGQASSTYEEAKFVSNWTRIVDKRNLIIPTGPFHTHRVKWIFDKLVGLKGIKIVVRPIYSSTISPDTWWQSAEGRTDFSNEVTKYLYYRFRY